MMVFVIYIYIYLYLYTYIYIYIYIYILYVFESWVGFTPIFHSSGSHVHWIEISIGVVPVMTWIVKMCEATRTTWWPGLTLWGFHKWGIPNSWLVYSGKSQSKMDENWGYPHFRKPPHVWFIISEFVGHIPPDLQSCRRSHVDLQIVSNYHLKRSNVWDFYVYIVYFFWILNHM